MRKVSILSLIALFAIVISSCGSSNNVVSNHGISKRKYTKGFFFQRNSNLKTANTKVEDDKFKGDNSIAKTEKVEARKEAKETKREAKNVAKEATKENAIESRNVAAVEPSNMIVIETVKEEIAETRQFLSDGTDGIDWSVTENDASSTGESIRQMPYENSVRPETKSENKSQKHQGDIIFVLAVIFAILIPPLGVAIHTNIDWMKVLIAFLLTLLFVLPGMIYALLVVFDRI